MILQSWQNITLICGNHKDDYSNKMTLQQIDKNKPLLYVCPCFFNDNNKCKNTLSLIDFEQMMETVGNEYIDDNGNETCLTGYAWIKRGIRYKVIHHDGANFEILMQNRNNN